MAVINSFEVDASNKVIKIGAEAQSTQYSILANVLDTQEVTQAVCNAGSLPHERLYFSQGMFHFLPNKTNDHCLWDWSASKWVDQRTLDEMKATQWVEIKAARDAAITAPLVTQYGTFDAGSSSQKSITDAVMLLQTLSSMGTPSTIDFTLADNTTVTLSTAQMVEVGLLLGQRTQEIYVKSRVLRAAIDAATDAAILQEISWN